MKAVFRTSSAVLLLALYVLAAGAARVDALYANSALKQDLRSGRDSYLSVAAVNLFSPAAEFKSSSSATNHMRSASFQHLFGASAAGFMAVEQLLPAAFSRYVFASASFPIRLRKADLIFPFHYFW